MSGTTVKKSCRCPVIGSGKSAGKRRQTLFFVLVLLPLAAIALFFVIILLNVILDHLD